ncbi:MAG: aminoacyl-tRNA hydrolase, partial [Alphaproteobacteria bacterium]|nr:aminoacyl-tRNA hydrolase [Alphaproteobacteria bacterium]
MFLIVGLGNPGKEYENTRHNIGFQIIDKYAEMVGCSISKLKFSGLYGEFNLNGE